MHNLLHTHWYQTDFNKDRGFEFWISDDRIIVHYDAQ